MFDADNIAMEKPGGKGYMKVSIVGHVRKVNGSKTMKINKYNERIKGRG